MWVPKSSQDQDLDDVGFLVPPLHPLLHLPEVIQNETRLVHYQYLYLHYNKIPPLLDGQGLIEEEGMWHW